MSPFFCGIFISQHYRNFRKALLKRSKIYILDESGIYPALILYSICQNPLISYLVIIKLFYAFRFLEILLMKFFRHTIYCVLFGLLFTQIFYAQRTDEKFVADELLVKFKDEITSAKALQANNKFGSQMIEKFNDLGWQRVKLPKGLNVEKALNLYKNSAEVEAVQPNYYYKLAVTPNDPQYPNLYGMEKISAPAAWDLETGSADTIVAVIDTGIKYTHEDLAANMWKNSGEIQNNGVDDDGNGFVDDYYGYDFFFNDSDPLDENGHGTHVAGIIGAVGNNGLGVTGVNWKVHLMSIKIYDADGFGTTSAMLVNAYNYIRLMRQRGENIRVTNNSYAGCDEACGYDQATKDALDAMGDAGILNVFAAGNDNRNVDDNPVYPGSYTSPSILSVAASSPADMRVGFSNYGIKNVDLAAPGFAILSTIYNGANYGSKSGTSMASPHVAGAAALLSSYNPQLSNASLKATLMNSVDVLESWNGLVKTGGRLNVSKALKNQTNCNFALSQNSLKPRTKGGIYTININAAQNCDFSIKSNDYWLSVVDKAENYSGNAEIKFRVSVNPTISRTGTLTIAGQTFTVTQSRN